MKHFTFITQTRNSNILEVNSVKSIFTKLKKLNYENINLIINHQISDFSENDYKTISFSKNIYVVESPYLSLSKARNLLLNEVINKKINTDFFVIIDDDVKIIDLEKYLFIFNQYYLNLRFDFASSHVLIENTKESLSRYCKFASNEKKPILLDLKHHNMILASALIISKEIVLNNIYFDPLLGIGSIYGGSEETDLFFTLIEEGYVGYYLPDLKIYHPKFKKGQYKFGKIYGYGLGRGYAYRKHISYKFPLYLVQFIISILSNCFAIFYYFFKFDSDQIKRQLGLFSGKIFGFLKIFG